MFVFFIESYCTGLVCVCCFDMCQAYLSIASFFASLTLSYFISSVTENLFCCVMCMLL